MPAHLVSALLALLLAGLAGCAGAPGTRESPAAPLSETGLPVPPAPAGPGEAVDQAGPLASAWVNATLGLAGVHTPLNTGHYASLEATGEEGLSGNCLLVDLPAAARSLWLEARWEPRTEAARELRFVVALPEQSRWVWNQTQASPLAAEVPVRLLEGQAVAAVLVQLPSGQDASAAVAEEVRLATRWSWEGKGAPSPSRPTCAATEAP